jgi:hypothetical protein
MLQVLIKQGFGMRKLQYLFSLFLLLASHSIFAEPHKSIDMRKLSDEDGVEREISFCAKPSIDTTKNLPGHMFVAFSTLNGKVRSYSALGHSTTATPKDALLTYGGLFPSVTGYLKEELYADSKDRCLVAKVNKKDYEKAYSVAHPALPPGFPALGKNDVTLLAYKLGANDCMSYMISVANTLKTNGLKVPDRKATELPMEYVRRLIDSN